jgi:uncharacterized membrane protein
MAEEMFAVWALIVLVGVFVVAFVVFAGLTLRLDFMQEARRRKAKHVLESGSGSTTKEKS